MIKTTEAIAAIYENGVFRPLSPVNGSVAEGQRVWLTVEPLESKQDSLELLRNVYAGLSEAEIDEIESIILDRSNWSRDRPLE